VHAQDAPALQNATLCDGRATSPCDSGDGSTQACPESAAEAFHEIQAQYDTPVFQRGTAPYLTAADGGDIVYDATGAPTVQRTDKVCVALSVPKGAEATMPANGWPVVIFAHGTGGGYRSFIDNGMAAALAHVTDSEGATLGRFVVVGIDGSMHGPRRGSDDDPDELFFNLRNPKSVRDNVYQGAADKFQLVRLVKGLEIAQEVAGTAIKLDPDQIYFFGHSQGTVEGGPFLSYESDVKGAVMSGAGGYLIDSLLNKTRPQNIRGAVQFALADGRIGGNHPLLNLLQLYFDEVDTLHYGLSWAHTPVEGQPRKHLLLGFGAEDGFTPAQTIEHLARVSRVTQVQRCGDGTCGGSENCTSCAEDCPADACEPRRDALPHATAPLQGNLDRGGTRTTSGLLRYASHDGSYDDHFVLFRHPQAKQQMLHFLATAQQGGAPTIPAPTEE
jgi:pimeloyl-ACP methyl ester carboxylesterase